MHVLISFSEVSFSPHSGFLAASPETVQLVDDQMKTNDIEAGIANSCNPHSSPLEKVNFCPVAGIWEILVSRGNPASSQI